MLIGSGEFTYEWVDDWARIPDTESSRSGWAHPGVVVSETALVATFHQADPTVLLFEPDGSLNRSWTADVTNGHGMTLVKEGASEFIWFADEVSAAVIKTDLDGKTVMSIDKPDLPIYENDGDYSPTLVTVFEKKDGGAGDVWVSDGYGQSYVHRHTENGEYVGSVNGEEGDSGRFAGSHGVFVDTRKTEPELYITDRSNNRVQVYDLEGNYKRGFGEDFLRLPSAFAVDGESLIVAELHAGLVILDIDDNLVCRLGENAEVWDVEGWPNVPKEMIETGKFNSPHGVATDSDGNIYVAEWLIGGRTTKLIKQ